MKILLLYNKLWDSNYFTIIFEKKQRRLILLVKYKGFIVRSLIVSAANELVYSSRLIVSSAAMLCCSLFIAPRFLCSPHRSILPAPLPLLPTTCPPDTDAVATAFPRWHTHLPTPS